MKPYDDIVRKVLTHGTLRFEKRTGQDILSTFGHLFEWNMSDGFPLLTKKFVPFKTGCIELEWFLNGRSDLKWLLERNCHIWSSDAFTRYGESYETFLGKDKGSLTIKEFESGVLNDTSFPLFKYGCDLGPIYGYQWRKKGNDQLQTVINEMKINPFSRRHLISSWDVDYLQSMALPPCHYAIQFYVRLNDSGEKFVDLKWSQRSVDVALGLPINIMSYALLLMLVAKEIGARCGFLFGDLGDIHIYKEHVPGLKMQIERESFELPSCDISETSLFNFDHTKVKLNNYRNHGKIPFRLFT
jgi:thymidylate synthase